MKIDVISLRILGFLLLITFLFSFLMFFKYVSVGELISPDTYYGDLSEWAYHLGIFIAIMMGFIKYLEFSLEFLFYSGEKND